MGFHNPEEALRLLGDDRLRAPGRAEAREAALGQSSIGIEPLRRPALSLAQGKL
jgi:hypothetical protein